MQFINNRDLVFTINRFALAGEFDHVPSYGQQSELRTEPQSEKQVEQLAALSHGNKNGLQNMD